MISKVKSAFKRFFTHVKNMLNWKKITKVAVSTVAFVSTAFAVYFGIKYRKTKEVLHATQHVFKDTQQALTAVSAQATQLMLDNTVLSEMVGMVLHVPGEIYT